jgi:acyl-homoserine-lactone acylase
MIRFLVGLLLAGVLVAGCGGEPEPVSETPAPSPAAASAAPEPKAEPAAESPAPAAGTVTIYRDTWGIPHIYADTPADAAFGIGYAQAEDRLEDILKHARAATGTMAEAFGPDHVERDYLLRLMGNDTLLKEWWPSAPPEIRVIGDSYAAGVKAYMKEHPERVPAWAPDFQGWHCAAIGRAMILEWPVGTMMDDLSNKDRDPGRGSNEWAVMPSRSADGSAILLTDPHLTWEGMAVFHEARVHGGDLHMNGFFIVGSPLLGLGHNERVGWACTTGGPDTSDVYELELNPENPLQYKYDDAWRDFEVKKFRINIQGADPIEKTALYSVHGPVLREPDFKNHRAYAGATPYLDQTGLVEQMYRMVMAKNCEEFYQALGMNQYMEQNVMFADCDGNVYYVRTGRVPVRPEKEDGGRYQWDRPLPGNTSKTRWTEIHPIEDLVQIKNPPTGYLQNCNISPGFMTENSPMQLSEYLAHPYIYNVSWDTNNARGQRAFQLLAMDDKVSREDAMAIVFDVYDVASPMWRKALEEALPNAGERMNDPDYARAVDLLMNWDGQFTVDSAAAPVVRYWRTKAREAMDVKPLENGETLDEAAQTKLLAALAAAVADMKAAYGSLDVKWGDINLIGRGGKHFPAPGADFGGTETLFDVGGGRELPDQKGKYLCRSGSMSLMLMFFRPEGVESHSCHVWGVSGDPDSPHYVDQAEKLYSQRQLKPTWWTREELEGHIESEKTLETGNS